MRNPKSLTYVFNPTARTVDFTGTPGFDVRNLVGIMHPSGAFLYFPGDPDLGLDLLRTTGNVVGLKVNCSAFGASDPIICLYEDGQAFLPPNASTADRQDAQSTLLGAIRDALLAQRSETLWTDDSGARYVRNDKGGTITWTDVSGNASPAPGAGVRPDSDSGTVVSHSTYRATAGGTGFTAGDILDHVVVTDGDAGDLVSNFWLNVTAGSKVAAPASSAITPLAPLPDGAATSANQGTANTSLSAIAAGIGAPADAAPANDAASGSLIGLSRRGLGYLSALASTVKNGLLSVFVPSLDATGALSAANDTVAVACGGRNTVVAQVPTGGWTGNIVIEGSALGDFSDAVTLSTRVFGSGSATPVAAITAAGTYDANVTGLSAVRARANGAIANGPVTVLVRAAAGLKSLRVHTPVSDPLPVTVVPATAVATTDATYPVLAGQDLQAVTSSTTRQFIEIVNQGANPMNVRFGAAASAAAGRDIGPGMSVQYSGVVPSGAIHLYSTGGTTAFINVG